MARNSLAGKGKSSNHKGTGRDYSKEKAYQSSPSRIKYRSELNKKNRELGSKKGDGKDVSHKKDGGFTLESQKKNRGRNGQDGKPTKR